VQTTVLLLLLPLLLAPLLSSVCLLQHELVCEDELVLAHRLADYQRRLRATQAV
jgi:hypothetical protein